jgi:hypothetical protein
MSGESAMSLVRSARLYQDSLWLAESEPEIAWLLMVSALETAATRWRSGKEEPLAKLENSKQDLYELLSALPDKTIVERVAKEFSESLGATKKFVDFVLEFFPEEPNDRPQKWLQIDWTETSFKPLLRKIYSYRSKALHDGKPFPAPMCNAPYFDGVTYAEKPMGLASMEGGGIWLAEDTPLLLSTFEYITRQVLLNWWNSMDQNH